MKEPLITIIMNGYNCSNFVRKAIDSVIQQTWQNWEIIFWDNQSTDRTQEIVKSYDDTRIFYYHAPVHTKLYEARNQAIKNASGEFFTFLDTDDWWLPNKLTEQFKMFGDHDVALVYGNFYIYNEINNKTRIAYKNKLPEGYILEQLLRKYTIGLLTLMIRRSAIQQYVGPFDTDFHMIGDFDLVLRIASAHKISCVQTPVGVYREHSRNESIVNKKLHIEETYQWIKKIDGDKNITKAKNFSFIESHIDYRLTINYLMSGSRAKAFQHVVRIKFGVLKIKALIAMMLPRFALIKMGK